MIITRRAAAGQTRPLRVLAVVSLALTASACSALPWGESAPRVTVTVTASASGDALGNDPFAESAPATTAASPKPKISDTAPKALDSCALLSKEEAQVLAGRRLNDPDPSTRTGSVSLTCAYNSPPEDPGVGQVVVVNGAGALKALTIDRDNLAHPFTQVSGIGDEAWQEDGAIFARRGGTWVSVHVVMLDDDPELPNRLKQAASLVVSRLP